MTPNAALRHAWLRRRLPRPPQVRRVSQSAVIIIIITITIIVTVIIALIIIIIIIIMTIVLYVNV